MNTVYEQINLTAKAFVEFAWPMLVQSSLLILILLLADFLLRRKVRAVFRYWIWLLVLVKLVLPTSLSSPVSLGRWLGDELDLSKLGRMDRVAERSVVLPPSDMQQPIEPGSIETTARPLTASRREPAAAESGAEPAVARPVSVTPLSWQGAVFLAWLAVVAAMGLLLLQRAIFVQGLVAQANSADDLMSDMLEQCRGRMGVNRKVGLRVSPNATSPAVCGLFRPVILMPQSLATNLDSAHLRAVLMHELAHIKRGDLWVNLAQTILQIIYFYNPLLWLANAMIRRVREQAVDEAVLVAMGEKAQQYPQTLLDVAKLAFKRPALSLRLVGVVESKSALSGRIKHIVNRPRPRSAKLGIAGLLAVIITAVVLLPMAKADDNSISKESQCTATLPNGVSVELVGVCEHPSEGKQWWQPDGTILFKAPYHTTGSRSTDEQEGYVYYEFALKLSHPHKMSYFWMIPGSGHGSDTGSPKDESGHQIQALKAYATNLPREQKVTTVRIGATAAEWQTVATCKPEDREETYSVDEFAIAFGTAYLRGNKTLLPVVHNYNRKKRQYAVRVVAATKSGQIRTSGYSGSGGNRLNSLTYIFNELPLESVNEFHFQIRPYQWVTFRNVSLQPGVKTDVRIEGEPAKAVGADAAEPAKSTQSLKQLALALIMYAEDHGGKPAADLKELRSYFGNEDVFAWVLENVEYIGQDKIRRSDGRDHRRPIAYDKTLLAEGSGTNVAFVDGHVEFVPPRRLEELSITSVGRTDVQVEVDSIGQADRVVDSAIGSKYAWQRTDRYVPPNPQEFFPDDPEGGKRLDALFDAVDKDRRPDEEILSTVRQGFRRTTQHRTLILAWIGNRYIWSKHQQNPEAIEIMYHAIPMERHYAVYFGLSVVKDKTPNILRTLAEICMQGEDVGRITWGLGSQRDELVSYIEPYLQHEDPQKREIASTLLKHFRDELDFEQWKRQRQLEQKKIEFGDQLPDFRQQLVTGDSKARREVLEIIRRDNIGALLDDSFLEAMKACGQDPDSEVRRRVASIAGSRWVWSAQEQKPGALELVLELAGDDDRQVRYNAVYFGLSTVRNKTEPMIRRLVELALADHENNLYGRVVWGLRRPTQVESDLLKQILVEQLDRAKSDLHVAASVYLLHKDLFETEPPASWGLERVREHYPDDIFVVPFSAKEPFQPENEDALWQEFRKNLPDGIDAQRLPNIYPKKQLVILAKVRGANTRDHVKQIIQDNPRLRLGQVMPLPLRMQLFFEEMQGQAK